MVASLRLLPSAPFSFPHPPNIPLSLFLLKSLSVSLSLALALALAAWRSMLDPLLATSLLAFLYTPPLLPHSAFLPELPLSLSLIQGLRSSHSCIACQNRICFEWSAASLVSARTCSAPASRWIVLWIAYTR